MGPVPVVRVKLVHLLINLIKNGVEAMSQIKMDLRMLTISIGQTDKNAMIRIQDVGCGIKPDELEKIFKHGFSTKDGGHGFGLHSCVRAMAEMRGTIRAESEGEGKGATFTLEFPLQTA